LEGIYKKFDNIFIVSYLKDNQNKMTLKIYGVIVCSKCKRAWGISLSQKTGKCPQCGKKINVSKQKIFYRTLDLRDLQQAISKIQEKLIKSNHF